jgi:hypothetical protein
MSTINRKRIQQKNGNDPQQRTLHQYQETVCSLHNELTKSKQETHNLVKTNLELEHTIVQLKSTIEQLNEELYIKEQCIVNMSTEMRQLEITDMDEVRDFVDTNYEVDDDEDVLSDEVQSHVELIDTSALSYPSYLQTNRSTNAPRSNVPIVPGREAYVPPANPEEYTEERREAIFRLRSMDLSSSQHQRDILRAGRTWVDFLLDECRIDIRLRESHIISNIDLNPFPGNTVPVYSFQRFVIWIGRINPKTNSRLKPSTQISIISNFRRFCSKKNLVNMGNFWEQAAVKDSITNVRRIYVQITDQAQVISDTHKHLIQLYWDLSSKQGLTESIVSTLIRSVGRRCITLLFTLVEHWNYKLYYNENYPGKVQVDSYCNFQKIKGNDGINRRVLCCGLAYFLDCIGQQLLLLFCMNGWVDLQFHEYVNMVIETRQPVEVVPKMDCGKQYTFQTYSKSTIDKRSRKKELNSTLLKELEQIWLKMEENDVSEEHGDYLQISVKLLSLREELEPEHYTTNQLNASISQACKNLGLPKYTTYSFRRKFVEAYVVNSNNSRNSLDRSILDSALDHSDQSNQTLRYISDAAINSVNIQSIVYGQDKSKFITSTSREQIPEDVATRLLEHHCRKSFQIMYQHCKKDTNTPDITRTVYDNWLKGISRNLNIKSESPRVIVTRHYLDNIIKFITAVPDDSIFDFRKVDYPKFKRGMSQSNFQFIIENNPSWIRLISEMTRLTIIDLYLEETWPDMFQHRNNLKLLVDCSDLTHVSEQARTILLGILQSLDIVKSDKTIDKEVLHKYLGDCTDSLDCSTEIDVASSSTPSDIQFPITLKGKIDTLSDEEKNFILQKLPLTESFQSFIIEHATKSIDNIPKSSIEQLNLFVNAIRRVFGVSDMKSVLLFVSKQLNIVENGSLLSAKKIKSIFTKFPVDPSVEAVIIQKLTSPFQMDIQSSFSNTPRLLKQEILRKLEVTNCWQNLLRNIVLHKQKIANQKAEWTKKGFSSNLIVPYVELTDIQSMVDANIVIVSNTSKPKTKKEACSYYSFLFGALKSRGYITAENGVEYDTIVSENPTISFTAQSIGSKIEFKAITRLSAAEFELVKKGSFDNNGNLVGNLVEFLQKYEKFVEQNKTRKLCSNLVKNSASSFKPQIDQLSSVFESFPIGKNRDPSIVAFLYGLLIKLNYIGSDGSIQFQIRDGNAYFKNDVGSNGSDESDGSAESDVENGSFTMKPGTNKRVQLQQRKPDKRPKNTSASDS